MPYREDLFRDCRSSPQNAALLRKAVNDPTYQSMLKDSINYSGSGSGLVPLTPLNRACTDHDIEAIKILLECGNLKLDAIDEGKKKAYEIANTKGYKDICDLLIKEAEKRHIPLRDIGVSEEDEKKRDQMNHAVASVIQTQGADSKATKRNQEVDRKLSKIETKLPSSQMVSGQVQIQKCREAYGSVQTEKTMNSHKKKLLWLVGENHEDEAARRSIYEILDFLSKNFKTEKVRFLVELIDDDYKKLKEDVERGRMITENEIDGEIDGGKKIALAMKHSLQILYKTCSENQFLCQYIDLSPEVAYEIIQCYGGKKDFPEFKPEAVGCKDLKEFEALKNTLSQSWWYPTDVGALKSFSGQLRNIDAVRQNRTKKKDDENDLYENSTMVVFRNKYMSTQIIQALQSGATVVIALMGNKHLNVRYWNVEELIKPNLDVTIEVYPVEVVCKSAQKNVVKTVEEKLREIFGTTGLLNDRLTGSNLKTVAQSCTASSTSSLLSSSSFSSSRGASSSSSSSSDKLAPS